MTERQPGARRDLRNVSPQEFTTLLRKDTSDEAFFVDPLSGERVPHNRPPAFILQDERLRSGYDFLKAHASRITLDILLAPHRSDHPEDLGDPELDFEGRVAAADAVLFEGLGWNQSIATMMQAVSDGNERDIDPKVLDAYLNDSTYEMRKLEAINGKDRNVGFYDIEDDPEPGSPGRLLMDNANYLQRLRGSLQASPYMTDEQEIEKLKDAATAISQCAFEALREWYMVCGVGRELERIASKDPAFARRVAGGGVQVVMVAGRTHEDLLRKFKNAASLDANGYLIDTYATNPLNEAIPDWLEAGRVDKQQLRRILEG